MLQPETIALSGRVRRRRSDGLFAPVIWLVSTLAAVAAMTIGALLAVFTAAAVAVIALFAGMVVFLAGFVMRARRKLTPVRAAPEGVIEARKVDGTWVAYGWEPHGR